MFQRLKTLRLAAAEAIGDSTARCRARTLGGPWTTVPVDVDVTAYCTQASTTDNRFFIRLKNTGGIASKNYELQPLLRVLR